MQAQVQEVVWEREQLEVSRREDLSAIIDAAHKTKSVSLTHELLHVD